MQSPCHTDNGTQNAAEIRTSGGATLRDGFEQSWELRWRHKRTAGKMRSLIEGWCSAFPQKLLRELTTADIAEYVTERTTLGDAPWTLNARISALRVMGADAQSSVPQLIARPLPTVPYVSVPPGEKWWLPAADRPDVLRGLVDLGHTDLADLVEFICETGLRVEEALRTRRKHLVGHQGSRVLRVPGTKTMDAASPIPISDRAARLILDRTSSMEDLAFGQRTYDQYKRTWAMSRGELELPTEATLKGLRRSFAGDKHLKNMPTETLRKMLRHKRIETTVGYLQLTSIGDLEAARKFL